MNKYQIKDKMTELKIEDWHYSYKEGEYIFIVQRICDYNSPNYGLYKTIKCTEEDLITGNILKMIELGVTR